MFPLCEYVYCRLKPELWAVCIDKTHEYLSRAIYHLTPLARSSHTEEIFTLFLTLCRCIHIYPACQQCDFISPVWSVSSHCTLFYRSPHLCASSLSSPSFFLFFNPTEKWRIRCRYSVSSSARPSASLMSAWPLWSCPPMFWGASPCRFLFPFKSAPFYPNSSAMKADLKHTSSASSPCLLSPTSLLPVSTGLS